MKAGEIIAEWRDEVDDAVGPAEAYLWSPQEAMRYLIEAENEAVRRTRALVDSTTTAICQLALTTATGLVALDARVLFIRNARIAGQHPLRRANMQDMQSMDPYWQDATATDYPSHFITDYQTGKVLFWPPVNANRTVALTVVRDPLLPIANEDTEPEINARYHRQLKHWMSHRAYLKPDEETYKPEKSKEALILFEMEFGQRSSAIDEMWIQREQFEHDGTY